MAACQTGAGGLPCRSNGGSSLPFGRAIGGAEKGRSAGKKERGWWRLTGGTGSAVREKKTCAAADAWDQRSSERERESGGR